MRTRRSDAERVLSELAADARRSSAPDLDWDHLETALMRRVRTSGGRAAPEHRRGGAHWIFAGLGAAALALGAWLVLPHLGDVEKPRETAAVAAHSLDGDALPATRIVEARAQKLHVIHAGRAAWTLEPNGRASVVDHDGVITVHLLAGAIRAEVVPSSEPERFVVEAAATRVAVHGTVFRVELLADRNVVDVEQGVVAVGPSVRPAQPTALLRAPAHAEFTPAGETRTPVIPALAQRGRPSSAPAPRRNDPAVATEEAPLETPPEAASLPSALTIGEVEAGISPLVAAIARCFEDNTESSSNLRVTAQTGLTLDVDPDGTVIAVGLAPPLSPNAQSCSERAAYQTRFAPSEHGARITRVLELSR
jgi:ferric-dicitrate binding protein FerR (iron transport regulator)